MNKINKDLINDLITKNVFYLKKTIKAKLIKFNKQKYFLKELKEITIEMLETKNKNSFTKKLLADSKKKQINKKWVNLAFILVNIFVVVGIFIFQFSSGDAVSLFELISMQPYYRYLFIALGIFFLIHIIDAIKFLGLIKRSTGYWRPFLSYKVVAIGRYYDCITPMSTGGQPFQVFYLKNRGVKSEPATAIPFVKYFFWQIAWILICMGLLIFNFKAYINNGYVVQSFAWVSLVLNVGLLCVVLMLSVSKKIGPNIVVGGLKLLNKMHFIKDYKTAFKKVFAFVWEYQKSFKLLIKNFWQVLFHVVLNAITIILNSSLAYFIYLAFNKNGGFGFLEILTNVIICELAIGMIPLPGAAGAAEISFAAIFAKYFGNQTLVWAMLFWRIFTYFLHILQGLLILIYDYAIGNKKAKYYNLVKRFNGNKNYDKFNGRNSKLINKG